ncbi:MAG: hypothetical protein ACRDRP_05060 [Pseudonocardiaceae bacterium]
MDTLRARQQGPPGHVTHELTAAAPDGTVVTRPVAWWFEQPALALLTALADPATGWVTPGEPAASRFVTELASGDRAMSRVLREVAPGTAHRTWRTIAIDWIAAGCPLPAPTPLLALGPTAAPAEAQPPATALPTTSAIVDGVPMTAALSEDERATCLALKVPLLGLFQNGTWQRGYHNVPIYGNGALY